MSLLRGMTRVATTTPSLTHAHRRMLSGLQSSFEDYSTRVNTLKNDPGSKVKLDLYALFKQATKGPNDTKKPGMLDIVGKAKWDAWKSLGQISKDDAMQKYVDLVQGLVDQESATQDVASSPGEYKTILTEVKDKAFYITLNRPEKFNAVTIDTYEEIGQALKKAAEDDRVTLAVIRGAGKYFSAGNDLNSFQTMIASYGDPRKAAENGAVILEKFVKSFIEFPKPLIGLVHGPAIGIMVTTLSLYDVVWASDSATFQTPFPSLGQSPEGCSSFTFPRLMGASKAAEMLLFERKLNAQEALDRNLVSDVIPHEKFWAETQARLTKFAALPPLSLRYTKEISRAHLRETLLQVNKAECERLVERWTSDECVQAIMKFMTRKSSKL